MYYVVGATIGGIFQFICIKYIKNHPNFLEKSNATKIPKNLAPAVNTRGGIEISITFMKIIIQSLTGLVADQGFILRTIAGGVGYLSNLPKNQLSLVLYESVPSNLRDFRLVPIKNLVTAGLQLRYLCSQDLKYLQKLLENSGLSLEDKEEQTLKIISSYKKFKDHNSRVYFLNCVAIMLMILSLRTDTNGFFALMKGLLKAVSKFSKLPQETPFQNRT